MPESIDTRIKKARPRLALIAPLTNAIIIAFALGNLVIGYGVMALEIGPTTRRLPIVTGIFTFDFYGWIFIILGLVMLWGLWTNHWELLRKSLLFGVLTKSIWTVALVFAVLRGGSVAVMGAWLILLAIQAATYIYFVIPPRVKE